MKTITKESMLLPEDLAGKSAIHCLSCGQKVGFISYFGPPLDIPATESQPGESQPGESQPGESQSGEFEKAAFDPEGEAAQHTQPFKLRLVTLTVNAKLVQGVVGSKHFVRFECDCGSVSIYHLIL